MNWKKRLLFVALIVVVGTGVPALGWAATPSKDTKAPMPPPPPPPKVFEDGTPWEPVDQVAALKRAQEVPELVQKVVQESPSTRKLRLGKNAPTLKDMPYRYLVLDSPVLKKKTEPYGDLYGPVRFMHMKHASVINDCTECHHYKPDAPDASETTKCSACHQDAFNPEFPERLGLKAAYHQQCIECHEHIRSQSAHDAHREGHLLE